MVSAMACLVVSAKTIFPVGDWNLEKINNNTEFEVDAYKGTDSSVSTLHYFNDIPITSIGTHAFNGNTTLTSIKLNNTVAYIQDYAFLNCSNLSTVTFYGEVTLIAYGVFAGCSSLSSINLEDTFITTVSNSSFKNCDALEEVTLPSTVTVIESEAFAYCDNLKKITIPATVTSIAASTFKNSPNVVIYCYKDSAAHTFAETNSIEYVLIDETPVETYVLGDTDGDGEITVLDASAIQFILVGKLEDTDGRKSIRGDIDMDDVLSVMDAASIQRYLVGVDDGLGIGNNLEY